MTRGEHHQAGGGARGVTALLTFRVWTLWFHWRYGTVSRFTSQAGQEVTASSHGGAVAAKQGQKHAFLFHRNKYWWNREGMLSRSVAESPASWQRHLAGPTFCLGVVRDQQVLVVTLGAYIYMYIFIYVFIYFLFFFFFFYSAQYWTFEWCMIYKGNDSPVLLGRVLPDHNIAYLWDTM